MRKQIDPTTLDRTPGPVRELLFLVKKCKTSEGDKKEKYERKIINWRGAYPEYEDYTATILEEAE